MRTNTVIYTRTHSVTYVTDYILKNLQTIVISLGLDASSFSSDYSTFERGISTWLKAEDLEQTTLEIYNPTTDKLIGRFDFSIRYDWGADETLFWADEEQIRIAIRKAGINVKAAKWRIVVSTKPGSRDVDGWSPCNYRSTEGMVRQSLGSSIEHRGLTANLSYWRPR